ncbi:MAG: family 16 glycosylhydrolase [Caldilineaceae bacterium]
MNLRKLLTIVFVFMLACTTSQAARSAQVAGPLLFDDMEHGDPFGNGWFAFGGSVGGGGIDANSSDLPPQDGGSFSLQTGWGSGGTPGFYGGFGRTKLLDLSGVDYFNMWINPDAGQDYTLEINLQDDDNGDDAAAGADDDEFQYNCVISPSGPCAISGGGWQQISIPLADFFDDNSFLTGGNGTLDAVATANGGNGQLVNVVIAVIGNSGSDATFRTDYWVFTAGPAQPPTALIDDFEAGLPMSVDGNGLPIGFLTFSGNGSAVDISTSTTPPAPIPGAVDPNTVLQMNADVTAFAGFIHAFENEAHNSWVAQDWSAFEGFRFWLYGQNSGTELFIDLLDNRNPGSTTDDAERWTVTFADDFAGWQLLEFPFADFSRKEIGNGAPKDGLGLNEVHGWAFGTLDTGGPITFYIDDVSLYGVAQTPDLEVSFAVDRFDITEGATGAITVKLNRPMNADDPAQVTVDYATEPAIATPGREYTPAAGALTFVNGGPSELTFPLQTFDDSKYEGDERIVLRLSNLVDVAPGSITQASAFIVDNDAYDPTLIDDFEQGAYLWHADEGATLNTPEIAAGDMLAVPGQDAYEHILDVATPILVDVVISGNLCKGGNGVVPLALLTTADFDAANVDHNTVRLGAAAETHRDKKTGAAKRHAEDFDGDGDMDLVFHFRANEIGYVCGDAQPTLMGETFGGQPIVANGSGGFGRDFAIGQDWSRGEALRFWFYGTNSGDAITVQLKNNRAPDPGPSGWSLVWSDEFDEPAGTPPNPANWSHEIGDVTPDGKDGWGNEERQYYTDDPANAATDGNGNLALTLRAADGSQQCYYGPCEYTSARLISWHKAEFAYGRIESRIKVPQGAGIWPAFWSLGNDIDRVPWPQTGEIDFMEFVGRLPNEIFGTIHGPGYAGGQSIGNDYHFAEPVYNDYHTFAVEWQPDLIQWYVDDILYHTATPADLGSKEWVFNDPVFLLLNVAVGGNFGGAIGPDLVPPQSMLVDYVRVYQGPDTAEHWETSFADSFSGWQEVVLPFSAFARGAEQPAGAPDDGLNLDEVWGYGFALPEGGTTSGALRLDQVRLQLVPPPTAITVTNLNNSGSGSLRQALADIAIGGAISFDASLAGGEIALTSGPLTLSQDVIIDGSSAPGLSLNGGGTDRLLVVNAGVNATVSGLTFTNGYAFQLAGGILNNGSLTLDHVTVTGNSMTTDAGDFWQGGAGIYNGEGSSLHLIDSTVANNSSGWAGGGIYAFFNTSVLIERSTISGNTAQDVGGGLRTLGNVSIQNSTLSGNVATNWHGGAAFVTDGVMNILNSTIVGNSGPADAAGGLFVGTFTTAAASLNLTNSVVANNTNGDCFAGFFGAGAVALTSGGHNVAGDASCNLSATGDQPNTDPLLGPLTDNGGPTLTHALLPGSPAIDAADNGACPATDQRGVARPQGAGCDIGAYEAESAAAAALSGEQSSGTAIDLYLPIAEK